MRIIILVLSDCDSDELAPMMCDMAGFSFGENIDIHVSGSKIGQCDIIETSDFKSCDFCVVIQGIISGFYDGWIDDLLEPIINKKEYVSVPKMLNVDDKEAIVPPYPVIALRPGDIKKAFALLEMLESGCTLIV